MFEPPEITSLPLIVISILGFFVNLIGLVFFHDHAHGHGGNGGHKSHEDQEDYGRYEDQSDKGGHGGHGGHGGSVGKGTACIVKGSYCNCHYCKCEKGHVHCGGYGKGGHGMLLCWFVTCSFPRKYKYRRCTKVLV